MDWIKLLLPIRNNLTGLEGPYRIAQIIDGSVYRLINFRGEEPIPPIKKNIPQEIPQPIKHLNTKLKKKMMKFLMTTTMTTLTSDMIRASVRYHKKALLTLCHKQLTLVSPISQYLKDWTSLILCTLTK